MKKFFLVVAALGMLATSCTKDDAAVAGGESLVSFTIDSPELMTRAKDGKGQSTNHLQYAFYDENGVILPALSGEVENFVGSTKINISLVEGREYSALFWADNTAAPYQVNFAGKTMTIIENEFDGNADKYDAFYKYQTEINPAQKTHHIELTRPFAQVNIATADKAAAANAGFNAEATQVTVRAHSTLNLATGVVGDNDYVDYTYTWAALPTSPATATVGVKSYEMLSMNYVLVNGRELVNVKMEVSEDASGAAPIERNYTTVPVQRNYRTYIVGNLLTTSNEFEIETKPGFKNEEIYEVTESPILTDYVLTAKYKVSEAGTSMLLYSQPIAGNSNSLITIDYGDGTFGTDSKHVYDNIGEYIVKYYFEDPITEIGNWAFHDIKIQSVIIPKTVVRIGALAFSSNLLSPLPLKNVVFEENSVLEVIGRQAFAMTSIESFEIPKSVKEIEPYVFTACHKLKRFIVEDGGLFETYANGILSKRKSYGKDAITYMSAVVAFAGGCDTRTLTIDYIFDEIYEGALSFCNNVEEVVFTKNITNLIGVGNDCASLVSVTIPSSVTTIDRAFINCAKLQNIEFAENSQLTTIGERAFSGCPIMKIFDASNCRNIKSIHYQTFEDNISLETIKIGTITPPELNSAVEWPANCMIYVPYVSVNDYKNSNIWIDYADKIIGY